MTETTRGRRLAARRPHHPERPTRTSRRTGQQRRAPNHQSTARDEVRAPIRRAVTPEEREQQGRSTLTHRERLHPHHPRFSFEFRRNTTRLPFQGNAPSIHEPESEIGGSVDEGAALEPQRPRTTTSPAATPTQEDGTTACASKGIYSEMPTARSGKERSSVELILNPASSSSSSQNAQEIERPPPIELMESLPECRVGAQVQEFSRWASTSAGRSRSPQHGEERAAMDAEFVAIADGWFKDMEWSGTWSTWRKGEQDTSLCPDEECQHATRRVW